MQNIIVFMTDDHAQWALGAYGNQDLYTPNLDYLAQNGVQMTNAFTPTPVCSPSRACFFTGRIASQHGVHDYLSSTDPEIDQHDWMGDEVTLAQILAQAGYETALCGKWHLGDDSRPHPGFAYWFSLSGDYPAPHGGSNRYCDNGSMMTISGYKTRIITDKAVEFLHQRDAQRPFFLFIGHVATHHPWSGQPERLAQQYRACTFSDIPIEEAYPFGQQALESVAEVDRDNAREALAQYYAAVSHIDESVGRVLDTLDALELRDDTLIVYTSDHGLNCGHHGIWGKGNGTLPLNMVEESIRVPLLLNLPGTLPGGQKREEFIDHPDLFQTLLEYAGVPQPNAAPQPYPGRSIWPLLVDADPSSDWRDVQFGEYGDLRMVRTQRYKLVSRSTGDCDLFDLQDDPREMVNLAADPAYAALITGLRAQLAAHFQTYADPVKTGLRVRELPRHNQTEAWRVEQWAG